MKIAVMIGSIKGNKRSEAEDVVGSIKIEFTDWKYKIGRAHV